jgi:nucleotide-binding universal stress UspA family protein
MTQVMACIDGSAIAPAVCDYAAWASLRLQAGLTFLHVLDHQQYPVAGNFSGNIGLGSREHLLEELVSLDAQRSKLALQQGQGMLEAAKQRAIDDGVDNPQSRQRHGDLVQTLQELEVDIRLLVIGKQGETSGNHAQLLGSQLENVIRSMHRPILVASSAFKAPQSLMLAFDGSATTRKGVDMLAASPLFKGLPVHLVMVGADKPEARTQLDWARATLEKSGFEVTASLRAGQVEEVLCGYRTEHQIDLIVMGAYGHSKIREFLVGSTTTKLIRQSKIPLLLLR